MSPKGPSKRTSTFKILDIDVERKTYIKTRAKRKDTFHSKVYNTNWIIPVPYADLDKG